MNQRRLLTVLLAGILLWTSMPRAIAADLPSTSAVERAGFHLLQSDGAETLFELITPAYTVETVAGVSGPCQQIHVEGYAQGGDVGAPQLPVTGALVGVPAQADLALEVLSLETELVSGLYELCPAPQPVAEEASDGLIRYVERATLPDPAIYRQNALYPASLATLEDVGFLRSQRLARVQASPFQVNPVLKTVNFHRRIVVRLRHEGGLEARTAAIGKEPTPFEETLQSVLLNYETAQEWRGNTTTLRAAQNGGWMPPSPAYRIAVREEGLYELTFEQLTAAGLPTSTIDPKTWRLLNNGKEMAIRLVNGSGSDDTDGSFGPGDRMLFYANGVDEKYTQTNVYWLTYGGSHGLRMQSKSPSASSAAPSMTTYQATVHFEQNINYVSAAPDVSGYEHWFGQQVRALGWGNSGSGAVSLTLPNLAGGPEEGVLEVALVSITNGSHQLRLYLNDVAVYEGTWIGKEYYLASAQIDQALLKPGSNSVKIELTNGVSGLNYDIVYIDWVRLSYTGSLVAQDDRLFFEGAELGDWTYTVSGFSNNSLELYDITHPDQVIHMEATASGGTLAFAKSEESGRRYLAQSRQRRLQALSITHADTADLLSMANGADYIIISHADFLEAIQPLANYRAGQGYRVKVVDVQHIYDTFNHGRMSAKAIRDFLAYSYDHWSGNAPFYVLLVGDGTYDPKQFLPTSVPTYIPPYLEMVDPVMGETAADNRYVTLTGNGLLADMNLGRFPAQTAADVTVMVNKTIAYEQSSTLDQWNRRVLFVTDDLEGGGGAFYNFSNRIADGTFMSIDGEVPLLPALYSRIKLYLGYNCDVESCRSQIMDTINKGALLISYVGHGTKHYWAEEQLLNIPAISAMNNGDRLPIMLPMTCLEGYFHDPAAGAISFGEAIVLAPGRGAVASWSPTGLGLATGHDYLERGFFIALFHSDIRALGVATTIGKLLLKQQAPAHMYDDLLDTFILFGDPALTVRLAGSGVGSGMESTQDNHSIYLPALHK